VRKILLTIFGLWLFGLLISVHAETYPLTDGTAVTGDIVSFNESGIIFRGADDKYTDRILWAKFAQDALKQLAINPKIKPLVEPFVEIPVSERPQKAELKVSDVTRLELPPKTSLFSALFSSSVGLLALLLIYAANLYAAFEVSVCRNRPVAMMIATAAVLPILGPIIFLAMPIKVEAEPVENLSEVEAQTFTTPAMVQAAAEAASIEISAAAKSAHPETQIFKRGQFTFNRRFIETKFAGFMGAVRSASTKDLLLVVQTTREQFVAEHIVRLGAADAHFDAVQDGAHREIMVPFADILEVQIKHKAV
jgi:hypothetical protein